MAEKPTEKFRLRHKVRGLILRIDGHHFRYDSMKEAESVVDSVCDATDDSHDDWIIEPWIESESIQSYGEHQYQFLVRAATRYAQIATS